MKNHFFGFVILALCGLLAAGCCETPTQVKELALQSRYASKHMADIHQQDLRALASYDRARVTQFNCLLEEYFSVRGEIVNRFNAALDAAKRANVAELDHAFDQRAERFLAVEFWTYFRGEADKNLNTFLLNKRDATIANLTGADAFKNDPAQRDKSFIQARQLYLDAALKFEVIEGQYAKAVNALEKARDEYHNSNEAIFSSIKLTDPESNSVSGLVLSNNTAQVEQRITELQASYSKLDDANSLLMRYLEENNPTADFFAGIGQSFGALATVATNNPPTALSTAPLQSASGLPTLAGLTKLFADNLLAITDKRNQSGTNLQSSLEKAIQGILSQPINVSVSTNR